MKVCETEMGSLIGLGICVFLIAIGIGGCNYLLSKSNLIDAQAKQVRKATE